MRYNRVDNRLLIAFSLLSTGAVVSCAAATEVDVHYTVTTEQGEPLAGVPIAVNTQSSATFLFTDASGAATGEIAVAEGDKHIAAWLSSGERRPDLSDDERRQAYSRCEALLSTYAFELVYFTELESGVTSYSRAIVAKEAVTVTGRVTNELDVFQDTYSVAVRGGARGTTGKQGQAFSLPGVPKSEESDIIITLDGKEIHVVSLTADQTVNDVDLGDISLDRAEGSSALTVQVVEKDDLWAPGGSERLSDVITLIKADGSRVFVFALKEDGTAAQVNPATWEPETPVVPPGEYYVTPGLFNLPLQNLLYDAIRRGQQTELDAAGVPKVTAPGNYTINAKAARDAIIAATGGPSTGP